MTYKVMIVGSDMSLSLDADSPDEAARMYGERVPLPETGILLVEGGQPSAYHQYKITGNELLPVVAQEHKPEDAIEKPVAAASGEGLTLGCPACYRAVSIPTERLPGRHRCPHCGHEFDAPQKDVIEQRRRDAPRHHWLVLGENGASREFQGLEAVAEAMSGGAISPADMAVPGPLMPAVSVRKLAAAERTLRKLYDPLPVFADFWSWALVAIVPALCISLLGLFSKAHNPAVGLMWFAAIIVILIAAGGLMLVTLILAIPVIGLIIGGVLLILTVGSALGGYLALAVVGGGGMWVLNLLHKAMYPLARKIGTLMKVEQERIQNWEKWMEPVVDDAGATGCSQAQQTPPTETDAPLAGPERKLVDGRECIVFPCPECGEKISAKAIHSGMVQRCPACNERTMVPDVF